MRFSTGHGFYELNPFPGCNQIVVSNHSFIEKDKRGQGLGTSDHKHRLMHIKEVGYDYAICTVREDNLPQLKILARFGWKQLDKFFNKETEHTVLIFGKAI